MQRWKKRACRWQVNAEQRRLRRKLDQGRDGAAGATDRAGGPINEGEYHFADASIANVNEASWTEPAEPAAA